MWLYELLLQKSKRWKQPINRKTGEGNLLLSISAGALQEGQIDFLSNYLEHPEVLAFSATCIAARDMSATLRKRIALQSLLAAILNGQKELAVRILNARPELLLDSSAEATDVSGKKIFGMTPFQAAISSWDSVMVDAIYSAFIAKQRRTCFLSFNPVEEMYNQFVTIYPSCSATEIKGAHESLAQDFEDTLLARAYMAINEAREEELIFELNAPGVVRHDSRLNDELFHFRRQFAEMINQTEIFNFQYLIYALRSYIDCFADFSGSHEEQWLRRDLFWRQIVGFIQRFLPAWCGPILQRTGISDEFKKLYKAKYEHGLTLYAACNMRDGNLGYNYAVGFDGWDYLNAGLRSDNSGENLNYWIDLTFRLNKYFSYIEDNSLITRFKNLVARLRH